VERIGITEKTWSWEMTLSKKLRAPKRAAKELSVVMESMLPGHSEMIMYRIHIRETLVSCTNENFQDLPVIMAIRYIPLAAYAQEKSSSMAVNHVTRQIQLY
jgi:hypothetical protein